MFKNIMKIVLKPTQSGKTKWIMDNIIQDEISTDDIIIIISHNRTILSAQTLVRVRNVLPKMIESSSSKTGTRWHDVYVDITTGKCNSIVLCGNTRQFNHIITIIKYANNHNKSVTIYADEIDVYWKTFNEKILKNYPESERLTIIGLTASVKSDMFEDSGGFLEFIHVPNPISENYNRYIDNNINIIDTKKGIMDCYKEWLHEQKFENDSNIFLPGTQKNDSHNKLRDESILLGFTPIIINQHGVNLYDRSIRKPIKISVNHQQDIQFILKNIRKNYNINNPVVIIGYTSPGRGITLQSPEFYFTHACILVSKPTPCSIYQLIGRLSHNFKHKIKQKCNVYTTEKINEIVQEMEYKAINIHKQNKDNELVNGKDYDNFGKVVKPEPDYPYVIFNTYEEALQYMKENDIPYKPQKKKIDTDGFYTNKLRSYKEPATIMSLEYVIKNKYWGIDKNTPRRLHWCYEDVNDKETLRLVFVYYQD